MTLGSTFQMGGSPIDFLLFSFTAVVWPTRLHVFPFGVVTRPRCFGCNVEFVMGYLKMWLASWGLLGDVDGTTGQSIIPCLKEAGEVPPRFHSSIPLVGSSREQNIRPCVMQTCAGWWLYFQCAVLPFEWAETENRDVCSRAGSARLGAPAARCERRRRAFFFLII